MSRINMYCLNGLQKVSTHCTNCNVRDDTMVPVSWGKPLVRVSGVEVCPRCKCPEVMTETLQSNDELYHNFNRQDNINYLELINRKVKSED